MSTPDLPNIPIELIEFILHLARCNVDSNAEYINLLLVSKKITVMVEMELNYLTSRGNGYLPNKIPHGSHRLETICGCVIITNYYTGYKHGEEVSRIEPPLIDCYRGCGCRCLKYVFPIEDYPMTVRTTYNMGVITMRKVVCASGYHNEWLYPDGSLRTETCRNDDLTSFYKCPSYHVTCNQAQDSMVIDYATYSNEDWSVVVGYVGDEIYLVEETAREVTNYYTFFNNGYEVHTIDDNHMSLLFVVDDLPVVDLALVSPTIVHTRNGDETVYTLIGTIISGGDCTSLHIPNVMWRVEEWDQRTSTIVVYNEYLSTLHRINLRYEPTFSASW